MSNAVHAQGIKFNNSIRTVCNDKIVIVLQFYVVDKLIVMD